MKLLPTCFWLMGFVLPLHVIAQSGPAKKSAESPDVATIRAMRLQSNKAIQERDLLIFGQSMQPDIEVTRGSGLHVSGRDSVLASLATQFKDPNFLGYVRDTDNIQISTSSPIASEQGHWTGRFQRPDGIQTLKGVYLAMWRRTETGWKIRSELFVGLTCTGSAACGK